MWVVYNFDTKSLKYSCYCIFSFNIVFVMFGSFLRFKFSHQPRQRLAYQWVDNVATNKYAKFDSNIPRGSRVISIYTYLTRTGQTWPETAKLMLSKASSVKKDVMPVSDKTMSTYIRIQNLIQLYHVVQELWAISLTANGRIDRRTHAVIIVYTCGSCNSWKYNYYGQKSLEPVHEISNNVVCATS